MGGSVISKETTARFASLACLCETLTFPLLSLLTLSVPGFTSEAMGRVYKALLSRNRERLTMLDAVVGRTINLAVDRILSIGFPSMTDCTISAVWFTLRTLIPHLVLITGVTGDRLKGASSIDPERNAETSKSVAVSRLRRRHGPWRAPRVVKLSNVASSRFVAEREREISKLAQRYQVSFREDRNTMPGYWNFAPVLECQSSF